MENSELLDEAKRKIASVRGQHLTTEERSNEAVELAALLLKESRRRITTAEQIQLAQLARMMKDPKGKAFTISMTDQCFRSSRSSRVVDQLNEILKTMGIPHYLSLDKKLALVGFKVFGKWIPGILVPTIKGILRKETAAVILPGEPDLLAKHMQRRYQEGVRVNLNHLGEAILGEEEAERRLQVYLDDLAKPEVEYISVKISTIYSQINLLSWDKTIGILSERFRQLLRAADNSLFKRADNVAIPKIVNLDMEEYRDLICTVEVFKKVLDEPEFKHQSAGIVLQSYLPDSFPIQQDLTAWAQNRVASGGAPIKIRIVKGANLAMEIVEASIRHWPQAPFNQKFEVDANFKRMVEFGTRKENASSVFLGIASHNLFDVAYAYLLVAENEVDQSVCFEMLEGMADHIRRVVQSLTGDMLLYCPAATKDEFQHALAYLVRRLDENTAPENFLRHVFDISPNTPEWDRQVASFKDSALAANTISTLPRRTQNRLQRPLPPDRCSIFDNEPDTDWSLPNNRSWAHHILKEWSAKKIQKIPLVIANETIHDSSLKKRVYDPSIPKKVVAEFVCADHLHLEKAISTAVSSGGSWSQSSIQERSELLADIAQSIRIDRGELIGAMIAETGKTIQESDVEVSEAIDFAEYYRRNIEELNGLQDISWIPKGVVLVAPPWNFPCSIPAGGILAALAAGNTVLFKPAPEAVLVGWYLAEAFWRAGVSKEILQFIPCQDDPEGSGLINDPRINCIILTGGTETAKKFLNMRPDIDLMAETGGKNAIIVSSISDRDLAIKDIVQSAFGHAGQKCSACSLAILEAEVYDDPHFRKQLLDAAKSLNVGSAWDPSTKVNPLIRIPDGPLKRALTQLDEGEEWLLEPEQHPLNPQLWSPGIKLGVKPGSFTHQQELFGPVLGVMRADNINHAIEIANGTQYGLTSGLHSLDEREKILWLNKIIAGNCYINRGITGAIVQRQPFGGTKNSSFGPGIKAGGPNYLMQLMIPIQSKLPVEKDKLDQAALDLGKLADKSLSGEALDQWHAAVGSYSFFWKHYFSKEHDPSCLVGQDNTFKYIPIDGLCLRLQQQDSIADFWLAAAALAIIKIPIEVSVDPSLHIDLVEIDPILPFVTWTVETEEECLTRAAKRHFSKLRLLSKLSSDRLKALAESAIQFQVIPMSANGRIELLKFLREVSISSDYHRYGNLGLREGEKRKPLPLSMNEQTELRCRSACSCQ